MLDHAREASELAQDKKRVDLDSDRWLNLALTPLLEIVGEAANFVPKEDQAKYSEIPWAQIVALRNRLIHGYDAVDLDVLWQIVIQDLPPLIAALEKIVPLDDVQ
jgi:uncharacterized protein with HEPN domain